MSSESDQYVVEMATSPQDNEALFKSKKWVYSVDSNSNGGQFGQEIQFDLGVLGSQGDWTLLSEAQIDIPVFTTISSDNALFATTAATATFNKDLTILKNGSHHFVHAVALSINGKQIQDFQNFQNISTHADMMTTFSQEELNKYSSTLHMSKVAEDYTDFENTSAGTVLTALGMNITDTTKNPSALERKLAQCNLSTGLSATLGNQMNTGHSVVQVATVGGTGFTAGSIVAGQHVYVKYDTITCRLKDICPAVKSIPPIKNIRGYLYVKVNAIEAKLTSAGATSAAWTLTSIGSTAGSSCPVQLIGANLLSAGVANAAGAWTLRCGPLGANPSSTLTTPQACHVNARLICPKYEANPAVDAALSMKKTFTVWERRTNRVSLASQQGNTFNINAGVPNPRFVRCYPYFVGTGTASTSIPATYNPFLSIVSSEGATTSPMAQLTNFNVYVGNKAVFQDPQNFDYENFCYEVSKFGINGGMDSTMSSGVLNSYLWEHFYRYYCADVSRRLSSEDGNMKGIQVQATNGSKMALDILVDTFSERQYTIDTALCQFV
jgi:hypothetical protein